MGSLQWENTKTRSSEEASPLTALAAPRHGWGQEQGPPHP